MPHAESELAADLERALEGALACIVQLAHPEAVILFGSRAEGRARDGSDVDLMVVASTPDPAALADAIDDALTALRRGRWGEMPAFDVVVLTPDQWEHERRLPGLLVHRVDRRGVWVYGRAA